MSTALFQPRARNTPLDSYFVLLFSFNSFFLFDLVLPSLTCAWTWTWTWTWTCTCTCACACACTYVHVHVVCRHTHHPRRNANAYTSTSQSGRHTPSSLRFLSSTHAKPARSAAASIALQTQSEPRRSRGSTCVGNQAGSGLGQLALRRLPSAPEHASGGPKLRPASANQPLVPHWPAIQALLSTSCSTVSSRRASGGVHDADAPCSAVAAFRDGACRKHAQPARPNFKAADWPRLAGAWGSPRRDLALRAASRAPAGQGLSHLVLDIVAAV